MHVEDKQMGVRVGYTVAVLIGVMLSLILIANLIG